jgi:predicted metalloprotease with PDZ domain
MKNDKNNHQKKQAAVSYTIVPKDLAGHLFAVTLTVAAPAPEGQVLALPAWIPGSYMIREFARNIVQHPRRVGRPAGRAGQAGQAFWRAAPAPAR